MKKIFLLIPIIALAFSISAQPPEGPANKGMNFGVTITEENAFNVSELPSLLDSKQSKEVKVKGKVVEVCKAEGCWLRMQTTDGTIMIRMKDHKFFVPGLNAGKNHCCRWYSNIKRNFGRYASPLCRRCRKI